MSDEGKGAAGLGCGAVVGILLLIGYCAPNKSDPTTKKLTDQERIDRMDREHERMAKDIEFQIKKSEADQWDKWKGR
jgi:hypothetical protein